MPRALTEQEKCTQCQRLLEKGKSAVLAHGIHKVSVEEIAKAAGMAKGSFYQHFKSKEEFLFELIEKIHRDAFEQAQEILIQGISEGGDLKESARSLLKALFAMPEMIFFIKNEHDVSTVLEQAVDSGLEAHKFVETELLQAMLLLAGIDTDVVKPGVVHNYVHALFLMMGSDLVTKEDLPETVDLITESLISYIFGGMP